MQELVDTGPSKSMRAMAHELKVSATLFCKIVQEDLRYKSYGLRKGQNMSEAMKLQQLEKTKKLLSRLMHPPTRRFGLLIAQTATPSTIMSGASLNRMLIKPPTTLIMKIMEAFSNLSSEEVALVCNRFRGRLEKVIEGNGDFIE